MLDSADGRLTAAERLAAAMVIGGVGWVDVGRRARTSWVLSDRELDRSPSAAGAAVADRVALWTRLVRHPSA